MATNQTKMKGTNIYDGVVMIFLNYPLIILIGRLGQKIEDKDVWIYGFVENLGQIITYLSTPIIRN
jgi:hypothetical protein